MALEEIACVVKGVNHILIHMKTATIRELRTSFPKLEAWLRNGEQVEITKHGEPVARLVPAAKVRGSAAAKPDILRRLKVTWGKRVFSAAQVAEMRAAEWEGQEG